MNKIFKKWRTKRPDRFKFMKFNSAEELVMFVWVREIVDDKIKAIVNSGDSFILFYWEIQDDIYK